MTTHRVTTDAVSTADIDGLRAALLGDVITPDDPAYDHARRVWNGVIDRRPALIVRCAGVSDVVERSASPTAIRCRSASGAAATRWLAVPSATTASSSTCRR